MSGATGREALDARFNNIDERLKAIEDMQARGEKLEANQKDKKRLKDAIVLLLMQSDCIYFQCMIEDSAECKRMAIEVFESAGVQFCMEGAKNNSSSPKQLRWRFQQWQAGKIALRCEEVEGRLTTDKAWLHTAKGWLPVASGGDTHIGARLYLRSYQIVRTYGKEGTSSLNLEGLGIGHLLAPDFPFASGQGEFPLAHEEYDAFMQRSARDSHPECDDFGEYNGGGVLHNVLGYFGPYWEDIQAFGVNPVPGWFTDGFQWYPMSIPRKVFGKQVKLCGIKTIERQPVLKPVVNMESEFLEMSFVGCSWLLVVFFLIPYIFCLMLIATTAQHDQQAGESITGWAAVFPRIYFACGNAAFSASFLVLDVGLAFLEIKMIQKIPGGKFWLEAEYCEILNAVFFSSMGRWKIFTVTTFVMLTYNDRGQTCVWIFAGLIWLLGMGSHFAFGLYLNVSAVRGGFVDCDELARIARFNYMLVVEDAAISLWQGGRTARTATEWKKRINAWRLYFQDVPMSIAQFAFIFRNSSNESDVFPIFALIIGVISGIRNVRQSNREAKMSHRRFSR